jgi:hypothetical protein
MSLQATFNASIRHLILGAKCPVSASLAGKAIILEVLDTKKNMDPRQYRNVIEDIAADYELDTSTARGIWESAQLEQAELDSGRLRFQGR